MNVLGASVRQPSWRGALCLVFPRGTRRTPRSLCILHLSYDVSRITKFGRLQKSGVQTAGPLQLQERLEGFRQLECVWEFRPKFDTSCGRCGMFLEESDSLCFVCDAAVAPASKSATIGL